VALPFMVTIFRAISLIVSLMAMVAMWRTPIEDRPDINWRRRRVKDGRWRRVIDGRWRGDIHRLRCECASYNSSDTKPHEPRANGRTIACVSKSRERSRSNPHGRRDKANSENTVHF
jgi:hypothetical protein